MKSQLRLGLRRVGKHHLPHDHRGRYNGLARYGLSYNLMMAFQMNCAPKHSDEGIQPPCYTMDYITGKTTWHGPPFFDITFGYIRDGDLSTT